MVLSVLGHSERDVLVAGAAGYGDPMPLYVTGHSDWIATVPPDADSGEERSDALKCIRGFGWIAKNM
ncbi:hypothetical protein Htur_3590 [Haloterrigena turkmenica DSM 5511]|uniref:Uncharacterized protein n=1 Tax=Haloterrigena turkmenica (strain ATCC 51198 / DSM 5511 / JCM 9101 / NCIMB 13204 / VKM B-1734 / 4k) TaxID=543526 RepID=D2RR56_HALTV|nr:hypothetical protein Htur_3590 [Haloterrigena turkmenica DSM 5511]